MTVTEYIKQKNAILFKHTGVVLVPEDQIEECEQFPLSINHGDSQACPYCTAYGARGFRLAKCTECPMGKVDNICNVSFGNTYSKVLKTGNITSPRTPWHNELKQLIGQYNSELED
jgi:hypothetical protein